MHWDVKNVIGKMTALKLEDDVLMAEFDVTDPEAQDKISAGVWDSISLSYELPEFKIMECSLVAVPAIPGAKIEAVKDTAAAEGKAAEDKAADDAETPAEDATEKIEVDIKDDVAENACGDEDKDRVDNAWTPEARIVQMAKRIESLEKQNKELSDLIVRNERRKAAKEQVRNWIQNGKTTPAAKDKEIAFVVSLDRDQLQAYQQLKACVVSNGVHGVRLSAPAELTQTREEQFAAGYKAFLAKARR